MRIVINDANILIDLVHLELVVPFFQLAQLELKTTDFVFEELHDEQKEILQKFIDDEKLIIIESEEKDLISISDMLAKTSGLSFEDCSVWHFAKSHGGILLTGDGRLRKQSSEDGVEVRGILFIFDQLLLHEIISFELAILKLNQLYQINDRLPSAEKNRRIELWGRSERIV